MSGTEVTDPALIAQLEAQSQVRGDDFLKTLDAGRASQVKALSQGRMELPKGAALRSPQTMALLADVAQYDPSFDVANAPARIAARKAWTSGKQGQNISAFNTALGHLGTLAQRADELENRGVPLWNSVANAAETATGDPRVSNFNIARQAVADELTRAFRGSGGNVHDIKGWEAAINSAQSPAQLRGAIGQAAELLGSRIQALQDQYNQAIGSTTADPLPMLNPHATDALAAFQSADYQDKGYKAVLAASGGGDSAPPAAPNGGVPPVGPSGGGPTPPSAPAAPSAPPPMAISDGTTEAATSEGDKRLESAIGQMVSQGKSATDIRAYITAQGGNPSEFSGIDDAVAYARTHKGYRPDVYTNKKLTGVRSLAAKIAGSGPGAAVIGAANTATFNALPKATAGIDAVLGRLTGDNRDIGTIYDAALKGANFKVNAAEDAHPGWALAGDVAGYFGGTSLLRGAARLAPGAATLGAKLSPTAATIAEDAAFGGLTGIGGSDNLADVPGNAAKGAALAAVGGVLGRGAIKGAANIASPAVGGAVRRLTDAGVTLTPGQVLGGTGGYVGKVVKGVEDRLAGFPVIGDVVNSTRRAGVEDFNRAAINDVLAPIGAELPAGVSAGHAGIQHAQKVVSDAIENALQPIHARLDNNLTNDIGAVRRKVQSMSKDAFSQFKDVIANDITPFWPRNGVMTGEQLQAIKRGLDKEIASRSGPGVSPSDRRLGERFEELRAAVLDFAGRADPANAAAFGKANEAYSLLSRVENAAAKSKDGVFTPNQFRQAVTKRGYGTTTKNVATGSARMQQLSTDASTILPSTVPDSGTAGREALLMAGRLGPGAVLGGAAGYHEGGSGGALAGALAGSALLSKPGAKAFQWALAGARGKSLNTLGGLLRRNARAGSAAAPLLLPNLSNEGN